MQCKLCGCIFDETKKPETCNHCMGSSCNKIKCPNCGYEVLPEFKIESKLINFLKRRLKSEDK
ncbi:DNA helicase PriA [Methanobacterium sp. MBAC-LM]|jgi:rubredoxin|uniref:DNA helicase PriA n=1 Tax=Methanobacterium sp. MBAC-LM TaxID=3412034 RepID=UPI003C74981F